MTESSDTSYTPAKPQDYAGLRAELAALVNDFTPLINELWPSLEDHKYRWELHSYGLAEGYDRLVISDIIALLIEPPRASASPTTSSYSRTSRPTTTIPPAPTPPDHTPPHAAVSNFPVGRVKGVFDVTT